MLLSTLISCSVNIRFLNSEADFISAPLGCGLQPFFVVCRSSGRYTCELSHSDGVKEELCQVCGGRVCRAMVKCAKMHVCVPIFRKTGTFSLWCVFVASWAKGLPEYPVHGNYPASGPGVPMPLPFPRAQEIPTVRITEQTKPHVLLSRCWGVA